MDVDDDELLCPKCDQVVDTIVDPRGEDYVDDEFRPASSLDDAGEVWVVWKEEDMRYYQFHTCLDCAVLLVTNNAASGEILQFIGHDGIQSDALGGEEYKRRMNGHAQLAGTTKASDTAPRYNLADKSRDYLEYSGWNVGRTFWYSPAQQKTIVFSPVE